jgi:hypothetical protein
MLITESVKLQIFRPLGGISSRRNNVKIYRRETDGKCELDSSSSVCIQISSACEYGDGFLVFMEVAKYLSHI